MSIKENPSKNMPQLPGINSDYTGKDSLDKGLAAKFGQLNSVCFFLPSRTVGGYEFLFIRFSKILSSMGLKVYYVDYKDALASTQLQNTNITMINYQDNMKEINIDEPLHIITPITWAYQMPCFKNPDSKVYFYNAHPLSSEWTIYRSGMNFRTFVKFIKKLNSRRALCYMDFSCYDSMKRKTELKLDPIYVPVFNDTLADRNISSSFISDSEINLAWLGRLDEDKIYSVLNLLNNFNQYVTGLKKRIHIIGDGAAKNLIKQEDYPNLEIIFTGTIITGQLQDYMIKNIDLLFAMGMSLLEGAVLKIPAVLTLSSEIPLRSKQYVWLHHLSRFTLGIYENYPGHHNCTITGFDDVLDEIYIKKEKERCSIKAHQYFLKYHSVHTAINHLLSFMSGGSLSYAEYSKVSLSKNLSALLDKCKWILRKIGKK